MSEIIASDLLESISWEHLLYAKPSEISIEAIIKGLWAADTKEQIDYAIFSLDGLIFFNGQLYDSAVYIVPFLLQISKHEGDYRRKSILQLMSDIAVCEIGLPDQSVKKDFCTELRAGASFFLYWLVNGDLEEKGACAELIFECIDIEKNFLSPEQIKWYVKSMTHATQVETDEVFIASCHELIRLVTS